jgi:hypothetical protein
LLEESITAISHRQDDNKVTNDIRRLQRDQKELEQRILANKEELLDDCEKKIFDSLGSVVQNNTELSRHCENQFMRYEDQFLQLKKVCDKLLSFKEKLRELSELQPTVVQGIINEVQNALTVSLEERFDEIYPQKKELHDYIKETETNFSI